MARDRRLGGMTDEKQIAALRDEIRRAGAGVERAASVTFMLAGVALLVAFGLTGVISIYAPAALAAVGIAFCAAGLCARAVGSKLRRRRARAIRRRLVALPVVAQIVALSPLLQDDDDTRKIAVLLMDELRRGGEMSPTLAPAARGDEASPADDAP
jgi:hypothetical protein